ncbi:ATP-binding protein [Streptomyces sp. L7]
MWRPSLHSGSQCGTGCRTRCARSPTTATAYPWRGHPDEFAESGRGLQVVSALSDSWGWNLRAGGGKTVWALFRI